MTDALSPQAEHSFHELSWQLRDQTFLTWAFMFVMAGTSLIGLIYWAFLIGLYVIAFYWSSKLPEDRHRGVLPDKEVRLIGWSAFSSKLDEFWDPGRAVKKLFFNAPYIALSHFDRKFVVVPDGFDPESNSRSIRARMLHEHGHLKSNDIVFVVLGAILCLFFIGLALRATHGAVVHGLFYYPLVLFLIAVVLGTQYFRFIHTREIIADFHAWCADRELFRRYLNDRVSIEKISVPKNKRSELFNNWKKPKPQRRLDILEGRWTPSLIVTGFHDFVWSFSLVTGAMFLFLPRALPPLLGGSADQSSRLFAPLAGTILFATVLYAGIKWLSLARAKRYGRYFLSILGICTGAAASALTLSIVEYFAFVRPEAVDFGVAASAATFFWATGSSILLFSMGLLKYPAWWGALASLLMAVLASLVAFLPIVSVLESSLELSANQRFEVYRLSYFRNTVSVLFIVVILSGSFAILRGLILVGASALRSLTRS